MDKEILLNRTLIVVLGIVTLFSWSRNSSLSTRILIVESGIAKNARKSEASSVVSRDDSQTLRQVCASLRGRLTGSGQRLFCDLPQTTSSAPVSVTSARPALTRAPSAAPVDGGGVEVHYPEWTKRECIEVTGAAKCDPVSKAVKCPNGTRLVRVAFTPSGKGIRNRFVCN